MNKAKKIICVITLALSAMACAGIASAAGYVPLVRIPGLPATGPVDLSMYIIGLYNFLLSIVGIVAVMMLIFGGMRYITAMGSSTAISSAKDIVTNALLGLLLALISWVIVSTINPDVLYIQNPTSKLPPSMAGARDVACTKSNSPCVCNDLFPPPSPPTTPKSCSKDCRLGNHCAFTPAKSTTCIGIGASNTGAVDDNGVYQCNCLDGKVVPKVLLPIPLTCNDSCNAPVPASNHCGWEFLVVKLDTFDQLANDYGAYSTDGDYFYLDTDAELWRLFLTNNGGYDVFNVTATSYTIGLDTYDCAILVTEEIFAAPDNNRIFWVKKGIKIKSDGSSLQKDVQNSAALKSITNPFVEGCNFLDPAFALDGLSCVSFAGVERIWKAAYTKLEQNSLSSSLLIDNCEDCSLSEAGDRYRLKHDIVCSQNGRWFPQ